MRNAMWVGGGITGMGEIPMLGVREKGIAKVIRDIFRNGEKGFFYDPSDLKTQYQDSAGTTAVNTTGQPLGLVLDKSKGLVLGTEIISGGNFEGGLILTKIDTPSAISTWTLNTNNPISGLQDGLLSVTQAASTRPALYAPSPQSKQGVYEELSFDYKVISGSVNVSGVYNGGGVDVINKALSGTGRFSHRYFRSGTDTGVYIYFGNTLGSFQIDNVSVKQILGNHAYQTTSAARPIFRQKPILGANFVSDSTLAEPSKWGTGVTSGVSVNDNKLIFNNVTAYNSAVTSLLSTKLTTGKQYLLSYSISDYVSGTVRAQIIGGASINTSTFSKNGRASLVFTATAEHVYIGFQSTVTGTTLKISEVYLQEITGYHTDQNYIEYDKVDDKLITNLPSVLTNCTVLRAIPNVGTQVKYNQTLPMLYEDSSNHSGLIAIDRALTRKEQLHLMDELDKRAGAVGFDTTLFKAFDNNQEGFVFDPNDLSTMYQDAAGTIPITGVGQPVGLVLDKSKGLKGSHNLVINTTFDTLNGWTFFGKPTVTPIATGEVKIKGDGKASGLSQVVNTDGGWVRVKAMIKVERDALASFSGINFAVFPDKSYTGGSSINLAKIGEYVECVIYTQSTLATGEINIYFQNSWAADAVMYVKDVSVHAVAGNHAYQTVSASRPLLGRHPEGGARNSAQYSNGFSKATWIKAGTTIESGYLAPDGSMTASKLKEDTTSLYHQMYQVYAAQSSTLPMTLSFYAKAAERSRIDVFGNWGGAGYFDLSAGTAVGTGRSIQAVGNGWYRCSFTGVPTDTGSRTYVIRLLGIDGVTNQYTGDGVSGVYIWNAQLEASSIATAYQETTSLLDITEKSKANCYYLKFDGVDDFLQTNNIDFTGTDKVSLFAGVRKLSDAATGTVVELSTSLNTNNSGFVLAVPDGASSARFASKGTLPLYGASATITGYVAPLSMVLAGKGGIAQDIAEIRVNGVLGNSSAADQGTGSYGNYPLYIGRRGGASLPFNGHIYGLIGIGKLTSDDETTAIEKEFAKHVGVTLNV